jgi:hypothetical protein
MITDNKGYDPPVIEIQNCTKVYLMNLNPCVILKFSNIGKPFLIGCISLKFAVQNIFSNVLRISRLTGTSIMGILDCRLNVLISAYPQNTLIINIDAMITFKIIPYAPVAFIRTFCMYCFNYFSNVLIFQLVIRCFSMKPFIVCSSGNLSNFA